MGSITICNKTGWPLHIALKQIGVLYYKNYVNDGECFKQNTIIQTYFTIAINNAYFNSGYSIGETIVSIPCCVIFVISLVIEIYLIIWKLKVHHRFRTGNKFAIFVSGCVIAIIFFYEIKKDWIGYKSDCKTLDVIGIGTIQHSEPIRLVESVRYEC